MRRRSERREATPGASRGREAPRERLRQDRAHVAHVLSRTPVGAGHRIGMTSSRDADSVTPARSAQLPLVLFVCRLNTGASLMAEAILRYLAQQRVRAACAGGSLCDRVSAGARDCDGGASQQGVRCVPRCLQGTEIDIRAAFEAAFATLDVRIRKFLALPLELLNGRTLAQELERIGEAS